MAQYMINSLTGVVTTPTGIRNFPVDRDQRAMRRSSPQQNLGSQLLENWPSTSQSTNSHVNTSHESNGVVGTPIVPTTVDPPLERATRKSTQEEQSKGKGKVKGNGRSPQKTPRKRHLSVDNDQQPKRKSTQEETSKCSASTNETQKENKDKPYDCKLCENALSTLTARSGHYSRKHEIEDEKLVFLPDGTALVDSSLQRHVSSNPECFEKKKTDYKFEQECKLCQVELFVNADLLNHYFSAHKVDMTKVDVDTIVRLRPTDSQELPATHECYFCYKIFDPPSLLQEHILRAHVYEAGTSKACNTSAGKQVYNEQEAATTSVEVTDEASTVSPPHEENTNNKGTGKQVYNEQVAATTSVVVTDEASTGSSLHEENTNNKGTEPAFENELLVERRPVGQRERSRSQSRNASTTHNIYKCKCGLHFDSFHFLLKHSGNCSPDPWKTTCACKLDFAPENFKYHWKVHASGVTTFDVKEVIISDVEKIDVSGMTERFRNEEIRLLEEGDSDDTEYNVGANEIDARGMSEQANQEMSSPSEIVNTRAVDK